MLNFATFLTAARAGAGGGTLGSRFSPDGREFVSRWCAKRLSRSGIIINMGMWRLVVGFGGGVLGNNPASRNPVGGGRSVPRYGARERLFCTCTYPRVGCNVASGLHENA